MCDTKPGREAVMRADGALAQLLAMAVSETWKVTREACAALQQLAQDPHCARKMVEVNALESILSLLSSSKEALQESGLDLLSAIAYASQQASAELLSSGLLDKLHTAILRGGRCAACAMRALGDLAFEQGNSQIISNHTELRMQLEREADRAVMTKPMRSQALRVLAIIGENRAVDRSLGNSDGPYRRGVRILSMDGGGMKGLATLKMLERIERGTGRRIHELFDMIGGTSTGGILAFSMGVRRMTLQQCREIYTTLSKNVFKKSNREENPSWRDHISSLYASGTQSVRFAVKGSKHDAAEFEALLRERCIVQGKEIPLVDAGLHSGPRVFAMATRVSVIPAEPFVFRTYAHSPHADKSPLRGTCRNLVWHGVRASSAAPYYLADFAVDGERWQDGGVSCNNPSVVAVQEARCVWPDCDIDCIISLGSGEPPTKEREVSSISRYIDAGTALVESACSVDRADDALQTLCPLLPGCTYYRFQPTNDACNIELDDNDDGLLKALEEAASSYIASEEARFEAACSHLLSGKTAGTDPSRNTSSSPRSQARLPSITSPRASRRSEEPEGIAHAAGGAHCNLSEPVQRQECALEDVVHRLQTGSDGRQRRPRSLLLGLHACQDGLVLSWKRTAIALTDADALSARLLHGAGAKSFNGLPSEFFAQTDCENSVNSTDLFRAVSASSVLGTQHQRLNTAVVERCDPDDVLDRQRVVQNRFTWQGLAIALASAAPLSLVHSLLEVGARLVAMVSSPRNSDTYTWSELRAAFDDVLGHADDDPVAALSQHPCSSQLCLYARKHGDIVRLA
jgi:predicted acylesterase/phospholipase RssA